MHPRDLPQAITTPIATIMATATITTGTAQMTAASETRAPLRATAGATLSVFLHYVYLSLIAILFLFPFYPALLKYFALHSASFCYILLFLFCSLIYHFFVHSALSRLFTLPALHPDFHSSISPTFRSALLCEKLHFAFKAHRRLRITPHTAHYSKTFSTLSLTPTPTLISTPTQHTQPI
jgi:hypothetical protein